MKKHAEGKKIQGTYRQGSPAIPAQGSESAALLPAASVSFRTRLMRIDIHSWSRPRRYGTSIICGLVLVWVPVLLFLQFSAPTYTCKWTLILPGTGAGSTIRLDNLGQAAASTSSPYQSSSLDPKVTYKAIAESQPVLEEAATAVNLSVEQFGKPVIKLVDQASLLYFSIKGRSAEQAYHKALAITVALQGQLQQLRLDETKKQGEAVQLLLQGLQEKLETTQKQILTYQNNATVTSAEQLKELTISIEQLRKEFALLHARYQQAEQRTAQLTTSLRVSPRLAADTLLLQADPLFQRYLIDYATAEGKFADYNGKWGDQHPEIVRVQEQIKQAHAAMLQRGEALLGHPLRAQDERLHLLVSHDVDKRGQLLQDLIAADAEKHGIAAQVDTLQRTLQELEERLRQSSEAAAELAELNRQHQTASVVFTSALAQLDLGKTNPFTSYPLVQVLAAPTRPKQPDALKTVFALLGATSGSIFLLIGSALLWHRHILRQRILKSA